MPAPVRSAKIRPAKARPVKTGAAEPSAVNRAVGNEVGMLRRAAALTSAELARRAGISTAILSRIEDGARMVRVDRIIGSSVDAWVVFGRTRASAGGLIADRNSFVGRELAGLPAL